MPWFWPPEGPESLPSYLFTSTSRLFTSTGERLSWDLASERLLAVVLGAARPPILSVKPEIAHAFCYLAKTLRIANLVALPCNIVQEIIYVPTRTAPLSVTPTITPSPEFIAPQFLLPQYGSPPDFMDLAMSPYSLISAWLIGMISVFAFSSGGLSRFKQTVQEGLPRSEPLVDQGFNILPSAFYYSLSPIISMVYVAGLSTLVGAVMEATQAVLSRAVMPAPANPQYLVMPAPSRHTWFDVAAESLHAPGNEGFVTFPAYLLAIFALFIVAVFFFGVRPPLAQTIQEEPRWVHASSRLRLEFYQNEHLRRAWLEMRTKFEPVVDRDFKKHVYIYDRGGVFEPYEVTEYDAC